MFVLDEVRFAYSGQTEPYDFSLQVAAGEILGISGVSGSGKSTLLDLIAGFLTPHGGRMTLDDGSLLDVPPERRPVAILFQDDNLFDHLSVRKNLGLSRPKGQLPEAELTSALNDVGLSGLADRRAAQMSGGQKQRVALARCLLLDRPILLLDEPFAALDSGTAGDMRDLVRRLVSEKGWHTLLVSHQETDLAMADHRLSLAGGRLAPLSSEQ